MDSIDVKKLFERRTFTRLEREKMKSLYTEAELFVNRLLVTVPDCREREIAILKVKESLSYCETAVAVNPHTDAVDYEQEMLEMRRQTLSEMRKGAGA